MADIPNPWITDSEAASPDVSDTAAAPDLGRLSAAAVPISSSCGGSWPTAVTPCLRDTTEQQSSSSVASSQSVDPTDPQDATNHINEIFWFVRNKLGGERRAEDYLDLDALEASLAEPLPLFVRDDGYLRRRA